MAEYLISRKYWQSISFQGSIGRVSYFKEALTDYFISKKTLGEYLLIK